MEDSTKGKRRIQGGGDGSQTGGRKLRLNPNLRNLNLRRPGQEAKEEAEKAAARAAQRESESVSAGAIDRVIDLAFNPSRDKLREVTIIDRMQGRTFPLMDTMNAMFLECVKIAVYRQSPELYVTVFEEECPSPVFDATGELLHRTAQWQKSVAGKNLERATDIALAETEKAEEPEDQYTSGRGYED